MAELELVGVSVRRRSAEVLHEVSLDASTGEVVALLGANGVGKSTTLRTISALHRPHQGAIRLDGSPIDRLRPNAVVRLGVVQVPEGRQIFAGLTVRENLEMGARNRGRLTQSDLDQCFDMFPDLSLAISKKGGLLSGGQQQMLAIARGLMARPRFMLLDEPSLGLAPKVVSHIAQIIQRLPELGIGVILVEQNASVALDICDRAFLMSAGRVVLSGPAEELRHSDAVRSIYMGAQAPIPPEEGSAADA